MNKNQQAKAAVISEIAADLESAKAAVLVDYRGLTAEEDTELRRNLRNAGVKYRVLKNTMIRRAAETKGMSELDPFLNGPTAVAFSDSDPVAPAKIISECIKKTNKMAMKCGYVEGAFFTKDQLDALAALPSREELLAKMLGSLNAPLCNFLYAINAIIEKQEKPEGEGAA